MDFRTVFALTDYTLNADSEPKLYPLTVPDDLGLRLKRLYVDLNPILAGQTKLYETEAVPQRHSPGGRAPKMSSNS